MVILLTNDDGIYAPGLAALHRQLTALGDVYIVAPATEQSGVGHAITYLTPLVVKEVFQNERMLGGSDQRWGWAVQGSPADCVKIGVGQFCPQRPDLVVSGINAGLNAGINVLYSGTVAAAIEGAFYGITSVACSLQYEPHFQFDRAAELACDVIEQIISHKSSKDNGPQLYNINIPTAALSGTPKVCVAPMHVACVNDHFEKRSDPFGRTYYWLIGERSPVAPGHETDMSALEQGMISLTPLHFDLTRSEALTEMESWPMTLRPAGAKPTPLQQQFQQQQGGIEA